MRLVLLALTLVFVASVVSAGIDSERGSGKVFPSIVSSTPTPLSTSSNDRSRLYYNAIKALYLDGNLSLFVDRVMDGARVGHGRLQWLLGVLYANGVGVPQNDAAALMYYNFAALDGIPEAHVALGARYADGHGVMPNCQSALGHYKEAADAVAMTLNGFSDLSVADNFLNNPKWLDTSSQDSLFSGVISVEEMQEAQHTAVMMGVHMVGAPAQAQMGLGYFLGTIGPRDWNKAEQHFQRAAKEGDALAMGGLGRMYMVGDPGATPPIPRDWALAHHYFTEGAKKNDAMSENGMGYLHSVGYLNKGHVVPEAERFHSRPDFETAAIYFQRAGNRGLAEGLYNLGVLHLHGRGVTKSTDQAEVLLRMASHKGSVLALWQLGKHHERIGACPIALMFYRRTTYSASWYKKDSPSFSVQSADWLDDDFHEQMQHETAAADDGGPDYYMDQGLLHTHEASHEIRVELPETPLSRFLDQLVLAETGRTSSLVGAARLLEEMDVVDGDEPDPDVLHFAKHQTPPPSLAARLNHKRLLLLWSVKDSHGYWRRRRVVQAEAKKLLLHHLLLRCENGNNGYSNLRLGDFFYRGESAVLGVDVERALELYQKAAKDRHSQAEFNVGFMYHIGLRAANDSSRRGPMDVLRQLLQRPTEGDLHLAKRYYDKVMQSNKRAQVAAHIALTSLSFQQWWLGVDVGGYELPFAWVGPFSRRAVALGAYLYHLESVVMVAAIVGVGLCMVLRHHGD